MRNKINLTYVIVREEFDDPIIKSQTLDVLIEIKKKEEINI